MPRQSPFPIHLTDQERVELETIARTYTLPYIDVIRAKIVLYAADGLENRQIAERLDTTRPIVSKWRKRFFEERIDGLKERRRSGRPPGFSPSTIAEIKALACELPHRHKLPLSRFSLDEIRREAVKQG